MPWRSRLPCATLAAAVAAVLVSCAPHLTPTQELSWDAFKACQGEGPSAVLEQVAPDGAWSIRGRETEVFKVGNCMRRYIDEDVRRLKRR
jgi:hypothetical protein